MFFKIPLKLIMSIFVFTQLTPITSFAATSKVVVVRSDRVWNGKRINKTVLKKMLNVGMKTLTKKSDAAAWKELFKGCKKVALKVNTITEETLVSTRKDLAMLVADELIDSRIRAENISIYDRGLKCKKKTDKCIKRTSMKKAGYRLNTSSRGVKVFEARGKGKWIKIGKMKNRFFKVLNNADCHVNMPILKDHHIMGITFALKNHMGSVTNPQLFHNNAGVPAIANLNARPEIKNTLRLVVGDILRAQYHDGPKNNPRYHWKENAIILGTDPVAVDTVALEILKRKRDQMGYEWGEMAYGGQAAKYIQDAGRRKKLGEANYDKIDLDEVYID